MRVHAEYVALCNTNTMKAYKDEHTLITEVRTGLRWCTSSSCSHAHNTYSGVPSKCCLGSFGYLPASPTRHQSSNPFSGVLNFNSLELDLELI